MKFQLHMGEDVFPRIVELNSEYRMPVDAYGSTASCLIIGVVDMSNMNWKVILDEGFRSIAREGLLEFTIKEFLPYDLRELWLFLGQASYNRRCTLEKYEWVQGNSHLIRIRVVRNIQDEKSWSICYISDGVDIAQINQTADLVADIPNVEILVSGPKDKLHGLKKNIVIVDDQHMVRSAMISVKKNMLVEIANYQNILLLHDRYLISKTFFANFESFGYDFSIAVPKQLYFGSNVEYPGLLVEKNGKVRSVVQHLGRADFFVNGGCIVIKRDLARSISLNSFLAWQEMEDIDWSTRLIQNGEIPRLISSAVVYTVGTDESKTASIKPILFDVPKVDFLSELDCLAANHPSLFFTRLLDLIPLYIRDTNYRRRLITRVEFCRQSWDHLSPIHLTPLRFSFVLTLSLLTRFQMRPFEISRRRIFGKLVAYGKVLFLDSGLKSLLIIPGSIYLFFRKPTNSNESIKPL